MTDLGYCDGSSQPNGSITTYTGKSINLFSPHPDEVCMADIVAALPHRNRYNGQTIWPYSVCTHSCTIFDYVYQVDPAPTLNKLAWALMHDATEAYLPDIPRPYKHAIPIFGEHEDRLMAVIAEKYHMTPECPDIVKYADKHIGRREAYELFPTPPAWVEDYDDIGTDVPRWDVDESRRQFHKRLQAVFGPDVLTK